MPPGAKIFFDRGIEANRPAHPLVVLLSLGVAALILFGSLYPFGIQLPEGKSIWQCLSNAASQLAWARAGRTDRIANVLLYVPLGFCVFLCLDGRIRRARAAWIAIAVGALLSLSVELLQAYIPARVSSYWDWVCNAAGTAIGIFGAMAWRAFSLRLAMESSSMDRVALLGLCAWVAWRWAPFNLHVGLQAFKAALQPLSDPQFQLSSCLQYLAWWVVVAEQVFAWVNRARATESLLSVMTITLAGRFFFVDTPLLPAELLALVLVLPVLVALHRIHNTPRQKLLAIIFIASLLSSALPFWNDAITLSPAVISNGFDWWPFVSWIKNGMPIDTVWLAHQSFLLISAAWLLCKAGMSARAMVYWITGTLLLLELIKAATLYGGTITLPAFALLVTGLVRAMQAKSPRANRI